MGNIFTSVFDCRLLQTIIKIATNLFVRILVEALLFPVPRFSLLLQMGNETIFFNLNRVWYFEQTNFRTLFRSIYFDRG